MDIRLALMAGIDIPIAECQIVIHQPTIKEIAFLGEDVFFKGIQTLTLNKNMFVQDKNVLGDVSNFQIFMTVIKDKETVDKKQAVKDVLLLLFPQYNVIMSPQSLLFQKDGEIFIVDNENFEFLQQIIKSVVCAKDGPMDQQAFNPGNDKAREIAEKLMRGRQRVAEQNGTANMSIFSMYISTLSVGLQLSVQSLLDLTMFQLYDMLERYMLYINWDIDIRSRLAGAKPDNQPENWMKNIH